MLPRTFVHLPGIGLSTEKRLWDRGIHSWVHLRESAKNLYKADRANEVLRWLDDTELAWETRNLLFFYRHLPRHELWRLIPGFVQDIAYLDIETNGLALPPRSQSTTITLYFKGTIYQAHEHQQKRALLESILGEALLLCTYFGEVFDIPFLRKEFSLGIEHAHIDLCFWLKRLGYNGGLKKVEKRFEDIRQRQSFDIDGFDAVRLWRMYERGIKGALETLLAYNAEDTVVLESLLVKAYNMEIEGRRHLGLSPLVAPPQPKLNTEVDVTIYQKLRRAKAEAGGSLGL